MPGSLIFHERVVNHRRIACACWLHGFCARPEGSMRYNEMRRTAMLRRVATVATYLFVMMALIIGVAAVPIGAADHLDGPLVMTDSMYDINDVYAFQTPANASSTTLIMTVVPLAGAQNPAMFGSGGAYEFKIDNTGDAKEDLTYTATFGAPTSAGKQSVTLKAGATTLGAGMTGSTITLSNGGRMIAGLYDDPFFFDLAAFKNSLQFCPGGVGTNFFKGLNVMAIVVEVPASALGGKIGVWARTLKNGQQFDRMGRPAINTVFLANARKDTFNSTQPADDPANYTADVVGVLKSLGNDDATATKLAGVLLPDILTFDTASNAGFLNGRQLSDDVIDAELNLISGGKVKTDCVANDSNFSASFPYLAAANATPGQAMPGLPNTGGGAGAARQTVAWWAILAALACLCAAGVSATIAIRSRK
jgi:hypothetical protein